MVDVTDALRKLQPLVPRDVESWKRSLPLLDVDTRLLLEKHIIIKAQRLLGDWEQRFLLPPPPKDKASGKLSLGTVIYDRPRYSFGLHARELLQGLAIFGRSGAGKTNVVFTLLKQLEKQKIPFLFLDWKRTCRHLLPELQRPVQLHTPSRELAPLRFNPLIPPPGKERRAHITQVVDLLAAAYTLGDGAKSLLQGVISKAFEESQEWPTIQDVLRLLEQKEVAGRTAGWKASAVRALQSLSFPELLDRSPDDQEKLVERWLETSTIVELDALDENARKFLIPSLLLWLFHYRLQTKDRERLRLVVVVEEAHHVLHRDDGKHHEGVVSKLLRQCRELGIGMVIVDQHPSLVSTTALGNTYASICLNLKDPSDIRKAGDISLLSEPDRRFLAQMPVGQGVVKLQERWFRPFLVQFQHTELAKGSVTDEYLREEFGEIPSHSGVFRPDAPPAGHVRRLRLSDGGLSQDAMSLLHDTVAHPTDGVRARYLRLGFSMSKGDRLKRMLLARGMLQAEVIPIGHTRCIVLRPTPEAKDKLRISEATSPESILHHFWKHYYAAEFRAAGYAVQLEAPRTGGRVDILATKGPERIGLEVETGKSDVIQNVCNGLRSKFAHVVVVPTTPTVRTTIESALAAAGLLLRGRISLLTASEPLRLPCAASA